MIELSRRDLEVYKKNLISRRLSFKLVTKRAETTLLKNGVEVARLKLNNNKRVKVKSEALSLFSSVKKSINKFIVEKKLDIEEVPQIYPAKLSNRILYHELEDNDEFILIDVKHCYWRIAYLKGYISKSLYESVIEHQDPQFKLWRNMSLSCIIAPKKVQVFKNGREFPMIEEDTTLYKIIYSNIRFTAWNLFGSISEKIGFENVLGYNTDGIMVFEKDVNRVTSTLARNKLQYTVKKCFKHSMNEYITEKGKVYKI
jgi:hypothetical protein